MSRRGWVEHLLAWNRGQLPTVGLVLPQPLGGATGGRSGAEPGSLPVGFRAAGVACGIKASGQLDVGLLVCDEDAVVSRLASPATRFSLRP